MLLAVGFDTAHPDLRVGGRVSTTHDIAMDGTIGRHESVVGWIFDVVGGGCRLSDKEAEGEALDDG